jgi:phage/plasmid primase-like uncharacterized protein
VGFGSVGSAKEFEGRGGEERSTLLALENRPAEEQRRVLAAEVFASSCSVKEVG